MIEIIRQCFREHFAGDGILYAAPGRVNLIGEHTDYNLGFVLPGAIDKSFYMVIAPNGTQLCNLFSIHFDAMVSFSIDETALPEALWSRYVFGEIKELQALGCKVGGFNAVVASDIPIGAGISSSAAFTSVTGIALNDLFDLKLSKMELAKAGQMCEHHYVGVRCGIMDQFASLHGREATLMRLDCRSLDYEYIPFAPDGLSLLLLDTQVKHSLASSEYNLRRADCEAGVAQLRQRYPSIESLRDVSLEVLEAHRSELSPVVYNRCSFVVEENERLLRACRALEEGDYALCGAQMYGSHEGLSKKYEVSCPELDYLQGIAQNYPGMLGARMMGGGFGGCTINLLQEDAVDEFIEFCGNSFSKKFWKELRPIKVRIGKGAGIIV
ncbi:MAG: galactokinase [Bacteroidetes bacterium]|nr:galactokinase [Bacteroidota bacterium]